MTGMRRLWVHPARPAVLIGSGSVIALCSGFLPWLRLLRTDFTGFGMARLVVVTGDDYPLVPPSWLGLVWYAVPVLAIVAWITLYWRGRIARRVAHRWISTSLCLLTLAFLPAAAHYGEVRPGALLAFGGSVAMLAGSNPGPQQSAGGCR